jgi:uncharacterized membrane protein
MANESQDSHHHPANVAIHDERSRADRAVDSFVALFGSLKFIGWMTLFIGVWIALNTLAWGLRWDPYPWILLNLIFSTQASYAAPLILLSQNRQSEHDRVKAEHDYQVNETALEEIRTNTALTAEVHQLVTALREQGVTPSQPPGHDSSPG